MIVLNSASPSRPSTKSARRALTRFRLKPASAAQAGNSSAAPTFMRRDLIIGLIVSLAIHGGVVLISQLTKQGPPPRLAQNDEKVIQIEMPKIEPDEPEKVETEDQVTPLDIAPPMQQDVPQLVQVDSFVQPIQPPPPEGLKPMTGAIVIPQGNRGLGKGIEVFDLNKLDKIPVAKFQS